MKRKFVDKYETVCNGQVLKAPLGNSASSMMGQCSGWINLVYKSKVMEIGRDNLNYLCPLMGSKLTGAAQWELIINVKTQWEHLLGVQKRSKSKQNLWAKKGSKKEMQSDTVWEGHTARDPCGGRPIPSSHSPLLSPTLAQDSRRLQSTLALSKGFPDLIPPIFWRSPRFPALAQVFVSLP